MSIEIKIEPNITAFQCEEVMKDSIKVEHLDDCCELKEENVDSVDVKIELESYRAEESLVTCDKTEVKSENASDENDDYFDYKYTNDDSGESEKHTKTFDDEKYCHGQGKAAIRDNNLLLKQPPNMLTRLDLPKVKRKEQNISHNKDENKFTSFICDICKKYFKSKLFLRLHFINNECRNVSQTTQLHAPSLEQTRQKPYKCNECEKGFRRSGHLREHRLIHTGEKPFKCKVCEKGFSRSSHLRRHRVVHTGEKPFKCDVCEKCFTDSSHLRQHRLTHTGEKRFKCDVCENSFSKSSYLRYHKLTHTEDKSFMCEICKKGFCKSSDLSQHALVHKGQKRFKCEVCEKYFSHSSHLRQHSLIHTGEKSFNCDICEKSFRLSSSLRRHRLIHSGEKPFKCDICERFFRHSCNLRQHRLIHTIE